MQWHEQKSELLTLACAPWLSGAEVNTTRWILRGLTAVITAALKAAIALTGPPRNLSNVKITIVTRP